MNLWLAVLLAGSGSYAFRYSMILALDRFAFPLAFDRACRYVMPAVFAGLVAASLARLVSAAAAGTVAASIPVLVGVAVTTLVARRHPVGAAVFAGMAAMWCSRLLIGVAT
jgi:branched-subunit amino acid transport protein